MTPFKKVLVSAAMAAAVTVPAISFAATPAPNAATQSMTSHKDKTADHATPKKHNKKKTAAVKASGNGLKSPVNAAPKG